MGGQPQRRVDARGGRRITSCDAVSAAAAVPQQQRTAAAAAAAAAAAVVTQNIKGPEATRQILGGTVGGATYRIASHTRAESKTGDTHTRHNTTRNRERTNGVNEESCTRGANEKRSANSPIKPTNQQTTPPQTYFSPACRERWKKKTQRHTRRVVKNYCPEQVNVAAYYAMTSLSGGNQPTNRRLSGVSTHLDIRDAAAALHLE